MFTAEEKSVSDYTSISMLEVEELDLVEYLLYVRDSRIYNLMQTEDGQEYLENAWRITQTEPERGKLRNKFSNKSDGSN